jgi:uncharacterized protein
MMGKLLLLAFAIWLVLVLLKHHRRSPGRPPPVRPTPQDMVRCAHCGTYLPKAESILKKGAHYCCEEHSNASQ